MRREENARKTTKKKRRPKIKKREQMQNHPGAEGTTYWSHGKKSELGERLYKKGG